MKNTSRENLEITQEEDDANTLYTINSETQQQRIKQIIEYQKSLLSSSSLSSSNPASTSSSCSSSSKSRSLLELMKGGNTSLRRLFDMEHISLSNHFNDYSGSPLIKPILLWGISDTHEDGFYTSQSWRSINPLKLTSDCGSDGISRFAYEGVSDESGFFDRRRRRKKKGRLKRKKSFRRLPGFGLWRWKWFRLRRLKILICGRKF
ncbi:hypothetical protein BVC80_479g85 [Macleaya cordata]|uniref:Uncharacterized protein n=1 Tax=Macleaya cordata TaxID=56857 RepID=A0A200Q7N7_MACCD|nr:hypothetical protein BVC80_479g85 [Macleaya cordata]